MKNPKTTSQKILFIFVPFSIGYFLSYLYRSTNAVLAPYLNQDLGINAEELGLITSVYFLTFASNFLTATFRRPDYYKYGAEFNSFFCDHGDYISESSLPQTHAH